MKINLNNNNLKTKIISIVTAVAIWLYVIAVVDPDEKKIIENIPITITNQNEIGKDGYVIFPKEDLKTDITLTGRLSEINKINKNNIHIYGDIIDPVEGQNVMNLRTNISNRVSRDLKDNSFVVNLEKRISKTIDVKIKVPSNMKSVVESMNKSHDKVTVIGPRSLVNTVEYAGATLMFLNNPDKTSEDVRLNLIPYNKDNIPVENVSLIEKSVEIKVRYTIEKSVPVRAIFADSDIDPDKFVVLPDTIKILGDESDVKNINNIRTKPIEINHFDDNEDKKIGLEIPKKIRIKDDITEVTIKRK